MWEAAPGNGIQDSKYGLVCEVPTTVSNAGNMETICNPSIWEILNQIIPTSTPHFGHQVAVTKNQAKIFALLYEDINFRRERKVTLVEQDVNCDTILFERKKNLSVYILVQKGLEGNQMTYVIYIYTHSVCTCGCVCIFFVFLFLRRAYLVLFQCA